MQENFPQNQYEICEFIKNAKTADDFYIIQVIISNLFFDKNHKEIEEMLSDRDYFYSVAIENVFNNEAFIEAMGKVLEQYKAFQANFDYDKGVKFFEAFSEVEIKNKKLIFAALGTSLILTASVFNNLSNGSLSYTANLLKGCIEKIKNNFKYKYSHTELFTVISTVFNKKFYSQLTTKLEIKDYKFLLEKQKISSYLMSLVIKLSFKNARLNNLFKNIERDKLNGRFGSFSIYRLSNMIKKEIDDENKSVKELGLLFIDLKSLTSFLEPFRSNKNEENVFNLIKITLKEFKSQETFEEDLISMVSKSGELSDEIKNYSTKNFKAFSSDIAENNYEWSNKIFINCSKLLGAIGSLAKAVDKGWVVGASINEFVDWTSSVHKILNKYDIEDDWDKISRYLDQETNKIEWKSTFLTPTQISITATGYNDVSKEIFFGVVKTILGMINSDGGVIIVGLVEKPEDIVDKDIRDSLLEKNKKFFLDISEELSRSKMDLDSIKRKIQDLLKVETLTSVDNFNNLWNIREISIKSNDGTKEIFVYKIEVTQSDKPIFSVKPERALLDADKVNINKYENIWISLLKRGDARTIYVDPRKYY